MKKMITENNIKLGIENLNKVYSEIPETTGCLKYISIPDKDGGCGGRCCLYQNPSALYIEFMNTWKYVMSEFSLDQITDLIAKSVRNYLSDMPTKGCVFFDAEKKTCGQHETRPYNCRLYSQVPEEEFKPRYEALKVLQQKDLRTVVLPQCNLTETIGEKPIVEQSNNWWRRITEIEKKCGIPEDQITDDQNGTYRTFHDHIVLHLFPDSVLEKLTQIKMSGSFQEKELVVLRLTDGVRNFIQKNYEKVLDQMNQSKDVIEKAKEQQSILEEEINKLKK